MDRIFFTDTIAENSLKKHLEVEQLNHYGGILTLHGLVNLAVNTRRDDLLALSEKLLRPFYSGEIERVGGAYDRMYRCGGSASALLVKNGLAVDALPFLTAKAEELIQTHPRNRTGLFGNLKNSEKIWIDSCFSVCPFLTVVGKLADRQDFIDEAFCQMFGHASLLMDSDCGLFHQSMNFSGPGEISQDHWSRGNGWAALALAEMLTELPQNEKLISFYTGFMDSCRKFQDEHGLWHQEMTRHDAYVETSGSGLILYAIGRGVEIGVLPESYRDILLKGLRGYLSYIAVDGSVFHSCCGCLCPGEGKVEDYMNRSWIMNDIHSFGPVVLAFSQAYKLGIKKISIAE